MFSTPALARLKPWLPLAAILLCAGVLRVVLATGLIRNDEVNYAHAAFELARGNTQLDPDWVGSLRPGLFAPVAFFYAVFGAETWTTLAFPFIASLAGVIVMYLLGRLLHSERAGLVASLLWAVFPLDVFQAGTLRPDAPMSVLCAYSVYFLLLAIRPRSARRWPYLGLALLFLVWALAVKPLAIVLVLFYVGLAILWLWQNKEDVYQFFRIPKGSWLRQAIPWVAFALAASLAFLYIGQQNPGSIVLLAQTATNAQRLLVTGLSNMDQARGINTPLFLFTSVLLLASLASLSADRKRAPLFLLVWFGFLFLYFEYGTISTRLAYFPILDFLEARNFQFVLPPAVLLIAFYVAPVLGSRSDRIVSYSALLTMLVALALQDQLRSGSMAPWFYALVLLTLGLSILAPWQFAKSRSAAGKPAAAQYASLLLVLVCVASLLPTQPYHISYWAPQREYRRQLADLGTFLNQQTEPVYVSRVATARIVNLGSNFDLGFSWPNGDQNDRLRVGYPSSGEQAYVVSLVPLQDPALQVVREYTNPYQDFYLYETEQ